MVVLPNEEYLALQKQQPPLEKKYDKVLHQLREHSHISKDPIEQQYKQGEDLNELRLLREKMNTYYFQEDKDRGSQLLAALNPSVLEYNDAGEIVDKRTNRLISGSRIDDLVKYAVNENATHSNNAPHGWKEFVSILKTAPHIPRHVLNPNTLHELTSSPSPSSTTP